MSKKPAPIKVKILKPLGRYSPGQIISLETDEKGNILNREWRKKLKYDKVSAYWTVLGPSGTPVLGPTPDDWIQEDLEKPPVRRKNLKVSKK